MHAYGEADDAAGEDVVVRGSIRAVASRDRIYRGLMRTVGNCFRQEKDSSTQSFTECTQCFTE